MNSNSRLHLSSIISLTVSFLILISVAVSPAIAQTPSGSQPTATPRPPDTRSVPPNLLTASSTARQPKLDSALAALAAARRVSASAMMAAAETHSLNVSGDRVQVQIVTTAANLTEATAAIETHGGAVTGIAQADTVVQAWLPIAALEPLTKQTAIHFIRRPTKVFPLEPLRVGNSTTEALEVINAPAWHTAGYLGSGVKVGILDVGFIGYSTMRGVDLPANLVVKNFVDGETDAQVGSTTEHGTACAEVIHDLAPQADLYLAKVATDVDLAEAVAWLIEQEVDIISSSIGLYNVSPGDGTGPMADLVNQAQSAGILWITAAGNDREGHWGGLYQDTNNNKVHEFGDVGEVNCFVSPALEGDACATYSFGLIVGLVGQLNILVRWSDWEAVAQDYDLHLVRWNGSAWQIVPGASSTNPQTGAPGQTPTEWISYTFSADDLGNLFSPHGLVIERISGNRAVNFELFVPQLGGLLRPKEILTARSLANLADSPGAMTVAAVNVSSPYAQEFYSSEGPTNGPNGTATGGFTKPDIAGFANVSTESYGASAFNGTSAATPHVAGVAAIVLGAKPGYTPVQLRNFLETRAIDMGPDGVDTQFGYGRLHLGSVPNDLNGPPLLTGLPDLTVAAGEPMTQALDLWAYASDAEDPPAVLNFSLHNTPVLSAGVSIDMNRYIGLNPVAAWAGTTNVEVLVQDTGGLTATDDFMVTFLADEQPNDQFIYLPIVLK